MVDVNRFLDVLGERFSVSIPSFRILEWKNQVSVLVLKHFQRHGDLVLINFNLVESFTERQDMEELCAHLKCSRLACYNSISPTDFRIPRVKMLVGDDPWVVHVDNGVKYKFNVTRNMFCTGNIVEKLRVSKLNCEGETVVDMFCGIGYFTLQFLVHTGVKCLHAIDWNPEAIDCLRQNLLINDIEDSRCVIHFGDNNQVTPANIADRIYLGLIPTSRSSWKTACKALKFSSGGVLHLHENVSIKEKKTPDSDPSHPLISNVGNEACSRITSPSERKKQLLNSWEDSVVKVIDELLKEIHPDRCWVAKSLGWHKVKSFAPGILHMVLDVDCRPCR